MSWAAAGRSVIALVLLACSGPTSATDHPDLDLHPLEARPLAGARADVAALLLSGADRGSLDVTALAVPSPAGATTSGIDFWLEIDGASLLGPPETTPETQVRLELYAYAMTRAGELAGHRSRRIRIPMDDLAAPLRAGGVMLAGRLELEPTEVQLHLMVRDPRSLRFALRILELDLASLQNQASGASGAAESSPLPAALSPEVGEAWIVQRPMAAGATPVTDKPEPAAHQPLELETRRGAGRRDVLAGRYRQVLDRLASGDVDLALTELITFETETIGAGDDRSRARGWLVAAEEKVIEKLAAHDAECLLPLLVLHIKAHDRYVESADNGPFLPGVARRRILTLAQIYTDEAEHDLGRSLAASALAELGIAIDRAGLPMAASRMLREALILDGSHRSALLYLGYWHERRGAYSDAVPLLRRLLEVAPRSHQGRLRLALILARLDQTDEAADHLRRLIRDGAPDWLLAIAYQELGRLLLAESLTQEAARLLDAGVSRLPAQQRLRLQLAYALERNGQGRRAQQVIDQLPDDTGRLSPRNLYSRRPQTGDGRAREVLERHATARLPLLSQALEQLGNGG